MLRSGSSAANVLGLFLATSPVIALPAAPAGPATSVAVEALDSCLQKLNPDFDIGYERITSRCPQLARRLEESGWSGWLPRDWQRTGNDLSAGGLRELREMLVRESALVYQQPRRPSVADLPAVLTDLTPANSARVGWWARTKEWLRDVFERNEQESDGGWFTRLVGQNGLSQVVLEFISYVALTLVVLLAVVIIANELRVSGLPNRLRGGFARRRRAAVSVAVEHKQRTLDEVRAAPLSARPQLLLEMIIARLIAADRLPPARALTVRELTRAARLADEDDRERLFQLARTSERIRFSSSEVPSEELETSLERGCMLFERLIGHANTQAPEPQGRAGL